MAKKILILDDDNDFNNLLTDIFVQANYDVSSERDPETAINLFKDADFDLVVTDQKMPGLSGEEFIKLIRSINPRVPIIMVSAYLDNDTIRNLISLSVNGVFLKPLNVFSLLKRTAIILKRSEASTTNSAPHNHAELSDSNKGCKHNLGFPFTTYPCKASKSFEFAKKLYALRNHKGNMAIIGESGTPFTHIIADLKGFDCSDNSVFITIDAKNLEAQELLDRIKAEDDSDFQCINFVVKNLPAIKGSEKQLFFQLTKTEGIFSQITCSVRFIFCLNEDVDTLYDRGDITDDLYIFIGTNEIKAPSLNDIKDDIPLLAEQYLAKKSKSNELQPEPTLDAGAKNFLRNLQWQMGVSELESLLDYALSHNKVDTITSNHLKDALNKHVEAKQSAADGKLKRYLQQFRNDYVKSLLHLLNNDQAKTIKALGIQQEVLVCITKDLQP